MDNKELTCNHIRKYMEEQLLEAKMFDKVIVENDDEYFMLLCDLLKFIKENHRAPKKSELSLKFGYLPHHIYYKHFGKTENAIKILRNIMYDRKKTIPNVKFCANCSSVMNMKCSKLCDRCLDKEKNRSIKNINIKTDKNIQDKIKSIIGDFTFNYIDNTKVRCIQNNAYGELILKTSKLYNNNWIFNFKGFEDFSIKNLNCLCLGFDEKNKDIMHIWIVPVIKNDIFKKTFSVHATIKSMYNNKSFLIYSINTKS